METRMSYALAGPRGAVDCPHLNCACSCHAVAAWERLEAAGIDTDGLTPKEMCVLAELLPVGRVVNAHELERRVWNESLDPHVVRVNIARARSKLERQGILVKNKPYRGYWLERVAS